MTTVKKPSIPNIPTSVDPAVRAFLEATRESLQSMLGHRGDKLEKSVTFRDLLGIQTDLKSIRRSLGDAGIGAGAPLPPSPFDEVPAVDNFAVVGGFTAITLSWRAVSFKGYQFSRIWRSGTPLFEDAVAIVESPTSMFVDVVGSKQEFHYWVQHVGSAYRDPRNPEGTDASEEFPPLLKPPLIKNPVVLAIDGPLTMAQTGVTSADFDDIREQVRQDLIRQIEDISRQFDEAIEQLENFFSGGGVQDFTGLLNSIDSRLSGITDEYTLLAKTIFDAELSLHRERLKRGEDTAFVQRRVTETKTDLRNLARAHELIYADFYNPDGLLAARVMEINQAMADQNAAVASRFVEIDAEFESRNTQTNARITQLDFASADANRALATSIQQLNTKFDGKDSDTNARISQLSEATSSANSATALTISQLDTKFTNANTTTNGRITDLDFSLSEADRALTRTITQLETKLTKDDREITALVNEVKEALSTGEGSWAQRATEIETTMNEDRARFELVEKAAIYPAGAVYVNVGSMLSAERSTTNGDITTAKNAVLSSVRNDENGVVSQTIARYSITRPDGTKVSLDTLANVSYDTAGAYSALWGVRTTVGTTTAGVSLYNDGQKTSFIVNAQQFAIHQGSGASLTVPFSFQFAWVNSAGFVWSTVANDYPPGVTDMTGNNAWNWRQTLILDNAFIKQAAILRLAAKEITAEKIDATGRVRGGLFTGGVVELANVNGVWPLIQARGSSKTLEIDPNHPVALWFGDSTLASQITYNESSLTPAVSHRGKSLANGNFVLGNDGTVAIRRDSGGFTCLHNPNSTFFMWFGPTSGASNPSYANAIWYLDNQGRYPLPLVSKRSSGTFGATAGSTAPVVHLAQGSSITVTVELNASIGEEIYMQHPGQNSLTFTVSCSLTRNGSVVDSRSFDLTVMVREVEPNVCHFTGGKNVTYDIVLSGVPAGNQTFAATAVLDPVGVPLNKRHFFNGYSVAFRTFEVREF